MIVGMLLSRRAALAALMLGSFSRHGRAAPAEGPHIQWPPSTSLAGSFLVSPPGQDEGPFARSVVFLLHHDASGAMGMIINKPMLHESLARLLETLGDRRPKGAVPQTDITVHYGGPVDPEAILVLHSTEFTADRTRRISGLAAVSRAEDVLRALADRKGPRQFAFFAGYAGWAPGQLEAEIAKGWWVTVPAEADILFGESDSTKWQRAYDRRPVDL